jgi:hypothetical protein
MAIKRDGNQLVWKPGVGPAIVLAFIGFWIAVWVALQSIVKLGLGLSPTDFSSRVEMPWGMNPMDAGLVSAMLCSATFLMMIACIRPYSALVERLGLRTRITLADGTLMFRNRGDYPFFTGRELRVVADIRHRTIPLKAGIMGIPKKDEVMSSEVRVLFEQEGRRFRLVTAAPGAFETFNVPLVNERKVESFMEDEVPTIVLSVTELQEVLQAAFPKGT